MRRVAGECGRVIGEDNATKAVFALDENRCVTRLAMNVRRDDIVAIRSGEAIKP
ncbi:MAG TPA: hypothetical protein VGW34_13195 [Allosphingosinicella sp.]|nr:hypothetical protein [Allosphingosinicella sp.]